TNLRDPYGDPLPLLIIGAVVLTAAVAGGVTGAVTEKETATTGFWGLAESLIPGGGAGRAAGAAFREGGAWGVTKGIFYSALAVSDVFLVRSLVSGVARISFRALGPTIARLPSVLKTQWARLTTSTIPAIANGLRNAAMNAFTHVRRVF